MLCRWYERKIKCARSSCVGSEAREAHRFSFQMKDISSECWFRFVPVVCCGLVSLPNLSFENTELFMTFDRESGIIGVERIPFGFDEIVKTISQEP
ncbi:hypothetical protein Tco_0064664 [Tanacetum coccineum]